MTLEEAIIHAKEVVDSYSDTVPNCDCANEHRQLVEWLTELKERREKEPKHGEWEKVRFEGEHKIMARCTNCKVCFDPYSTTKNFPICPYCGAKMT